MRRVEITFECARDKIYHLTCKRSGSLEEKMEYLYTNANNKMIMRPRTYPVNGAFEVPFELPARLKPGTYTVKAFSGARVGTIRIEATK